MLHHFLVLPTLRSVVSDFRQYRLTAPRSLRICSASGARKVQARPRWRQRGSGGGSTTVAVLPVAGRTGLASRWGIESGAIDAARYIPKGPIWMRNVGCCYDLILLANSPAGVCSPEKPRSRAAEVGLPAVLRLLMGPFGHSADPVSEFASSIMT